MITAALALLQAPLVDLLLVLVAGAVVVAGWAERPRR
jgi:hypothetical protein